jgi:CelD/BcsL family acetyltransferase involved in cellulose biosynthesis
VPAAAQLWLVKEGLAYIYKLAYDEAYGKLGVGTALSAALTRHVLDVDQVHEIDFLTGDDAYKVEWMSHRRVRSGMVAFRKGTVGGLLLALRHYGPKLWKRLRRAPDPSVPPVSDAAPAA